MEQLSALDEANNTTLAFVYTDENTAQRPKQSYVH